LRDGGEVLRQLADLSADQARLAVNAAAEVGERMAERGATSVPIVTSLVKRVLFRREILRVELSGSGLRRMLLGPNGTDDNPLANSRDSDEPDVIVTVPLDLKRRGVQMKLVVDGERMDRTIDLPLVTAVSRAHCWVQMLMTGEATSIEEIAERERLGAAYVGQLLPLGFLDPDQVEGVLLGDQPHELTAGELIWRSEVPLKWRRKAGPV
jgi:hypothetical protein